MSGDDPVLATGPVVSAPGPVELQAANNPTVMTVTTTAGLAGGRWHHRRTRRVVPRPLRGPTAT